jgi:cereblon
MSSSNSSFSNSGDIVVIEIPEEYASSDNETEEENFIAPVSTSIIAPQNVDLEIRNQHSYLPGDTDPLFPEDFIYQQKYDRVEMNIPIIQLAVTPFPQTTIPLRITEPRMVRYLSERISLARNSLDNNMEIKIGIVTQLSETRRRVERRIQTNQAGVRHRMGRWPMMSLRGNFIPSRRETESEDSSSSSSQSTNDDNDEIHSRLPVQRLRPEERSINYGRNVQSDELVGRIGTLVTITNVHGGVNEEIVITCFATKRFLIQSPVQDSADHGSSNFQYQVSILDDEPISFTRFQKTLPCVGQTTTSYCEEDHVYTLSRKQSLARFCTKTYLSKFAMNVLYPMNIVDDIVNLINTKSAFAGLKKMLLPPKKRYGSDFPFWLASNLPLSVYEKLHVLEASCHHERLHFLYKVMQRRSYIRCKQCRTNIAMLDDIFSVGSSAGTSGNYVNEYGAVHQTTTVSKVEKGSILCIGRPEVRDSWFPGYAWTIAICKNCQEHLGWKFTRVYGELSSNQPVKFWGLSGSQII